MVKAPKTQPIATSGETPAVVVTETETPAAIVPEAGDAEILADDETPAVVEPAAVEAQIVRVTAVREGFRRAGIAHFGTRDWQPGELTDEQVAVIKAERNLKVEFIPVDKAD